MENQQSSFMREQSEEMRETFEIKPILETLNSDPREQRPLQTTVQREYQAGYEGPYEGPVYRQMLGEKIIPRRPQMYNSSWLRFVAGGILLLALAGFMTGRYDGQQDSGYQGNGPYQQTQWSGRHHWQNGDGEPWHRDSHGRGRHHRMHQEHSVFEVPDNAQLMVNSHYGNVNVHISDDPNRIGVTTIAHDMHGEGRYRPIDVNAQLIDGGTVAVDVGSSQTDASAQIDLDITVPEMTNVDIHASRGVVHVDGEGYGHVHIDTAPGSIESGDNEG